MESVVRAPCRIDLAGGTLDLWPLYLYYGGLELVHMAVEIRATAQVRGRRGALKRGLRLHVRSDDLDLSRSYRSLEELRASLDEPTSVNPLRWVNRVAHDRFLAHGIGGEWTLRTSSQTPPGSGLGGSSVLGVALSKALDKALAGRAIMRATDRWATQVRVRDLEAVEIEHPAGDQDYVPALFGGLLIFKLESNSRTVERLPSRVGRAVAARTALLYTGKPHHSGINNWQVFKAHHDGDPTVRTALRDIRALSAQMAADLRSGRVDTLGSLLNDEWAARRRLAPAVNAPVLDEAWSFGHGLGATARKACGAGGGGCLLLWFEDVDKREAALKSTLPDPSWRWLPTELAESPDAPLARKKSQRQR